MKLKPYYIVGFIDGEGTIGTVKLSKNRVRPQLLVFNTNKEILESIKESLELKAPIFEASRINDGIKRKKICYRLQVRSKNDLINVYNFLNRYQLIIKLNDFIKFKDCFDNWL